MLNLCGVFKLFHLHLKHFFKDNKVQLLVREHQGFERELKEAIYVKPKQPSLNQSVRTDQAFWMRGKTTVATEQLL